MPTLSPSFNILLLLQWEKWTPSHLDLLYLHICRCEYKGFLCCFFCVYSNYLSFFLCHVPSFNPSQNLIQLVNRDVVVCPEGGGGVLPPEQTAAAAIDCCVSRRLGPVPGALVEVTLQTCWAHCTYSRELIFVSCLMHLKTFLITYVSHLCTACIHLFQPRISQMDTREHLLYTHWGSHR